ncbi:MAG: hypothetical protein AB1752_09770 [Candidatus Zixiibacteriota bacterium]
MRRLLAAIVAILLLGCASTTVQSKRDPEFTGPLDRLYVAVGYSSVEESYAAELATHLSKLLGDHGITTRHQVFDQGEEDLSLAAIDAPVLDTAALREFLPNGVLIVSETAATWQRRTFRELRDVSHDASLFVPWKPDRIWRASLVTDEHGDDVNRASMKTTAETIVKQLLADKLID